MDGYNIMPCVSVEEEQQVLTVPHIRPAFSTSAPYCTSLGRFSLPLQLVMRGTGLQTLGLRF